MRPLAARRLARSSECAPPPTRSCPAPLPCTERRGTPYCPEHPLNGSAGLAVGDGAPRANCSREVLAVLSQEHPALLNASIHSDHGRAKGRPGLVPHAEFARYK